jgi:organic radical activating enzyme
VCFRISGGEPTYWKHFLDLAKLVKSKGHAFSFLTNASRPVEYFKTIEEYSDGIILSYHREYADPQHLAEIIKKLEIPVAVNLMLDPIYFDEIVNIAKMLYDSGDYVAIWPKIILDKTSNPDYITNDISEYSDSQKDLIKNWPYFRKLDDTLLHRGDITLDGKKITANELMMSGLNQHTGWRCWAGLHMISIDIWGDIYRGECQQGGKLGNIRDYSLPKNTVICNKKTCNCLSDIYLKKEK